MQCAFPVLYCSLFDYHIFPHYLTNGMIYWINEHKMFLFFSTTFFWSISHSKKKRTRYDQKLYIGLHVKCPLYLSDFNETWITRWIFQTITIYHISRKSVQWEQSFSMRTDRHDEANSHFSRFYERAQKLIRGPIPGKYRLNPVC